MTNYEEFNKILASYGFIYCPIGECEFKECLLFGLDDDTIFALCQDLKSNAFIDFKQALKYYSDPLNKEG